MLQYLLPVMLIGTASRAYKSQSSNLSIKGVVEVKHLIRDRVRVIIPSLKGNTEQSITLKQEAQKIDVIKNITVSPITGSITIVYDQNQIEPVILLGILIRFLGLDKVLNTKEISALEKEYTSAIEAFDSSILNVSKGQADTKSLITTLLVAGLGYSIYKNMKSLRTLPTPITLLWWLYQNNTINKKS